MAKIECICENIINVKNEESEFDLVPGNWIELMCQKIETGDITERDFFESFISVHKTIYKCSNCYRYWFENKDGTFDSYVPEHKCKESLSEKLKIRTSLWKRIFMD